MLGIGLYGSVYLMPVFLAFAREHGPLEIGRIMLVTGIAQLVTAPIAVELERRVDGRVLMLGGFALFAVGLGLSAFQTWETDFDEMLLPQILRGSAIMFCLLPPTRLALGHFPPERVADASGLFNLMRNLGGAIGLALIDTVIYGRAPILAEEIGQRLKRGDVSVSPLVGIPPETVASRCDTHDRCGPHRDGAPAGRARRPGRRHQRGLGDAGRDHRAGVAGIAIRRATWSCSLACDGLSRLEMASEVLRSARSCSSDHPLRPRTRHVELVRLAGDRAGLQVAALVAADRLHLAGIAGGEDLVGIVELGRSSRCARRPCTPALRSSLTVRLRVMPARKRAVGHRRRHDAVLGEEDVGAAGLGHVAQRRRARCRC